MRIILIGLVLTSSVCLCAAQATQNILTASSLSVQPAKKGGDSLICNLTLQTLEWDHSHPVEVSAMVQNTSKASLDVAVVPAFLLKPMVPDQEPLRTEFSYSALWDLEKGVSLPVSATVLLRLKPGEVRKIKVDVATLFWSRINSPVLPHLKLFNAVPTGKYSMHLELTANVGSVLCSSNVVEVVIK